MLDRVLLNKTIRQIPDLKNLVACGRTTVNCYRSRIPFIENSKCADISLLLRLCIGDYNDLTDMSNYNGLLLKASQLSIDGYCTDRTSALTPGAVEHYIDSARGSSYGTQIALVNVTNRAHYPIISEYIRTHRLEVVTQATTQVNGKPVEFIGVRTVYTPESDGYDYPLEKYTVFTTVWDYDLNLSFVHTVLNHMLTNPVPYENAAYARLVKSRLGYTWFKKYFEGVDVTPLIIEYFNNEFVNKLEEIKRAALIKTLGKFGETKLSINDNITRDINRYHEDIKSYERSIAGLYEDIRRRTLDKLTESDKASLLEGAIKIFNGMLNKGTLTGFNYHVCGGSSLEMFSWCVRLPITYWEADEAKYWLNTYKEGTYKHDLFKAMFMDGLVTSWCEQYMTINLSSGGRPSNSPGEDNGHVSIYPPNPHVGRFNCFGNNANEVMRAISNKDVATAITICMNACMQLNMTDHTVTSYWMEQCTPQRTDYNNFAFLEYRGNMYTPEQLYNLYKKEGGFSNGEETQTNQQAEEADA